MVAWVGDDIAAAAAVAGVHGGDVAVAAAGGDGDCRSRSNPP